MIGLTCLADLYYRYPRCLQSAGNEECSGTDFV